jgi:hypothetical protein
MRSLLELRRRNLIQNSEYLRYLMEEAQQQGDFKVTQYRETMVQHTKMLNKIFKAIGKYTSHSVVVR